MIKNLKNKNIKIDNYKPSAQFELIKASKIKIDNLTLNFAVLMDLLFSLTLKSGLCSYIFELLDLP
jgi:hypothetical protein